MGGGGEGGEMVILFQAEKFESRRSRSNKLFTMVGRDPINKRPTKKQFHLTGRGGRAV